MTRGDFGGREESFASDRECEERATDDTGCEDDVVAGTVMRNLEVTRRIKDGFTSCIVGDVVGDDDLCTLVVDLLQETLSKG